MLFFIKMFYKSVDNRFSVVYNGCMKEKKHFIDAVLERERRRNKKMRVSYERRVAELPRGSLVIRKLNGREYCYLRYREGERVVQKYVGTADREEAMRAKIAERQHLLALISMLEEENRRIMKMEAIK